MLKILDKYQEKLYFIGRVFATFIIGPIFIYKGYEFKDKLLIIFGILLIIWDGVKLFFQIYFNDLKNVNSLHE